MTTAGRVFELATAITSSARELGTDDPVAFSARVGLDLDPWQQRVMASTRPLLINCTRQAGKSTVASVLVSHRCITRRGHLALLVSPSDRQSFELFRKVKGVLRAAGVRLISDNASSAELANGSRILSLPSSEDTIRGFSAVGTLVEDEAAFVSDAVNTAVRPMLAVSRGQPILMSTPNGKRGHFYEYFTNGGDAWERERVTCWEVPRLDRAFLEAERRAMGEMFRQEYECEFVDAVTGRVYQHDDALNVIEALP